MAKISQELRNYLSELGKKGGKKGGPARAAAMTPEQRSESARKAINARWAKRRKKVNDLAQHSQKLDLV